MKILISGAGAIGGCVGVLLKNAGLDVRIMCHSEKTKSIIEEKGFYLHGAKGERHADFVCYLDSAVPDEKFDIIMIATKYLAMKEAAEKTIGLLKDDGVMIGMQNGICSDELAEIAGRSRTVGCMIGFGATRNDVNDVTMTSLGEFYVGMADNSHPPILDKVRDILGKVLPTKTTDNITARQYSKLIINSCINAVAAISGQTLGVILDDGRARSLFLKIAREGMYVAKAMGLKVPKYGVLLDYNLLMLGDNKIYNAICKGVVLLVGKSKYSSVKPSTLQSLERGEKTEIDIFNGYFSRMGKKYNVKTPVNDLLYTMIKQIESGERPITPDNLEEFRGLI